MQTNLNRQNKMRDAYNHIFNIKTTLKTNPNAIVFQIKYTSHRNT